MPEVITREQFRNRFVELCIRSGLRGIPRRARDKHILLKGITLTFELKEEYTENEVNDKLKEWLQEVGPTIRRLDHVHLRRRLVDEEYLGRSRDGSRYWVGFSSRNQPMFEPDIDHIDVHEVIRASKEEAAQRKQEYLSRQEGG